MAYPATGGAKADVQTAVAGADAIRDAANLNDIILDPFGGSGTINIAAEDVGRRPASIEMMKASGREGGYDQLT